MHMERNPPDYRIRRFLKKAKEKRQNGNCTKQNTNQLCYSIRPLKNPSEPEERSHDCDHHTNSSSFQHVIISPGHIFRSIGCDPPK